MTVERLDQDTIQNGDAAALLALYKQNRPELAGYWPGHVPNPQTPDEMLALFPKEISRVRVDRINGVIFGVMATSRARVESVMGLYLRLRDHVTGIPLDPPGRRNRLRTSAVALGRDWFLSGGNSFQVNYPEGGHASMVDFLDEMTAANGVQPEIRSGMRIYRWTAAEALRGLDAVRP